MVALAIGSLRGMRRDAAPAYGAAALGAGLNARGALEIVIASVGLSLSVFSETAYTVIVLVPLVTSVFASVSDMVADPAIDAVWICTPNYTRLEVMEEIVEAVESGKGKLVGVACEKPLGRNAAEARRMLELVERAGLLHGYLLWNGDILLPVYFKKPTAKQYSATVVRCRFDGTMLRYVEHGSEHRRRPEADQGFVGAHARAVASGENSDDRSVHAVTVVGTGSGSAVVEAVEDRCRARAAPDEGRT